MAWTVTGSSPIDRASYAVSTWTTRLSFFAFFTRFPASRPFAWMSARLPSSIAMLRKPASSGTWKGYWNHTFTGSKAGNSRSVPVMRKAVGFDLMPAALSDSLSKGVFFSSVTTSGIISRMASGSLAKTPEPEDRSTDRFMPCPPFE